MSISDHFMAEYIGAAKYYPFTTIPYLSRCAAHLYIVECSTIQCSPAVLEGEELSHPYVECEVPRELLLHRDQLMPPLEIIFERFEENIWKI